MSNSLFNKTKKNNSTVPKYAIYLSVVILDFSLDIFFVVIVYIAHNKGVIRAYKYPKKLGASGVSVLKSPPVTNKKPPNIAIANPVSLIIVNFSLKNINAKMVINTGDKRQTNKAGKEGPIKSIAKY